MKRLNLILISTIILLVSFAYVYPVFAQRSFGLSVANQVTPEHVNLLSSHGLDAGQIDDFQKLVSSASGKVEANFNKTIKIPDFVEADLPVPPGITRAEEKGYHYLEKFKQLYRIKAPRKEMKMIRTKVNRRGQENIRFQQYYKGIKVLGAEMIVHVNPGNRLWFVQGKYIPDIDISTSPVIDSATVPQIIGNDFKARVGADTVFTLSSPEPAILNPSISDRSFENKNVLIWVSIAKEKATGREWKYYVEASNGQVLMVMDSLERIDSEIWDNQNTSGTGDDQLWYQDDVQTRAGTPDAETTDLNNFVTEYWDYLHNTFGVHSIDSSSTHEGMQLEAHAYYESFNWCPNAGWSNSSQQAVFCEGMVTRDIVAHEFSHGLSGFSGPDFDVPNQSGALEESFSDIFGEFLDVSAGATNWMHGTSRDLSNPLNQGGSIYPQSPDHVGSTGNPDTDHPLYWPPCDPSTPGSCSNANDNGGKHYNNAVPSMVAYLIVNGTQTNDPHYNYQIRGLGIDKAEQLYYDTLVDTGLTSSADFTDTRNVMYAVCSSFAIGGTHGFTTNDCCQVRNAWKSVGVGSACSALSTTTWGSTSTTYSPYFVTANTTIPSGQTLTVPANVDIYFFPNTKIEAAGTLAADGTAGDIRFLSSRGNKGMRIWRQYNLTNGGEFKIPVKTFVSTDTQPNAIVLADPEAWWTEQDISSFIRIDNGFTVTDVNVTLNINHSFDSELTVTLESPDETSVTLFSGVGGSGNNFTNTTMDDEAATAITAGTAPFTGSFQPTGNLSDFDGENSAGYWRLHIDEPAGGGTGSLEGWSITFNQ